MILVAPVLLIESLAKHWRDSRPLRLLIVSPTRSVGPLRRELPRFNNVEVSVRAETDFFAPFGTFYLMTGWYRQQIIKLHVPAVLGFNGYLTLDSDVCCVGDFDATTFVSDRRALSRWEPKRQHEWWRRASELVGILYDADAHGLSVTPNILHGALAGQVLGYFAKNGADPLAMLSLQVPRKLGSIPWTEYSLYTSVAERNGNLLDYHLHWDPCYFADTQLFSEQSCVWHADDFDRLMQRRTGSHPGGKFIIVQSHARIPLQHVRDYCLSFAAG